VSTELKDERYQGPLRQDALSAMKEKLDCRKVVFDRLDARILAPLYASVPKPTIPPSANSMIAILEASYPYNFTARGNVNECVRSICENQSQCLVKGYVAGLNTPGDPKPLEQRMIGSVSYGLCRLPHPNPHTKSFRIEFLCTGSIKPDAAGAGPGFADATEAGWGTPIAISCLK
jgi:hypothetical protein